MGNNKKKTKQKQNFLFIKHLDIQTKIFLFKIPRGWMMGDYLSGWIFLKDNHPKHTTGSVTHFLNYKK